MRAADVLGGQGADRGGYVDLDGNDHWWIPSGRVFLSPNSNDTAAQELACARQHFFLPQRYVAFGLFDLGFGIVQGLLLLLAVRTEKADSLKTRP